MMVVVNVQGQLLFVVVEVRTVKSTRKVRIIFSNALLNTNPYECLAA